MPSILVVDDERGMREALKTILVEHGHKVTEAENGKIARDLIGLNDFDLVISDFQMPFLNGVELLTWIKANKPMPVILITGFSHIIETQQAFELGADDFMTKPFSYKDILSSVGKILDPKSDASKEKAENEEAKFCRIPIEDFVSSAGVQINVYVKLGDSKFVRVAHKGDQLPVDRVETYKHKGVTYLYARKEDFGRLVGFNLGLSKIIQHSSRIPLEKKVRFLRYTTELVLENAFINGIDSEAFRQAADCLNVCLSIVTDSDSLFEILEVLNSHADWIYAHSLGVSLYSVMIGRRLGWTGQATLFKLGTAGLFHDIGEKEIDLELLTKNRLALTLEERKLLETHPTRGKEILQQLKEVSDDIVQIVHEHHEDCMGQGFPRRVNRDKIHPLAKVVFLADKFCEYAMVSPRSPGCNAVDAIQQVQFNHAGQFDKASYAALKSLCSLNNTL